MINHLTKFLDLELHESDTWQSVCLELKKNIFK
jgi:hypothetical protein